ncbi:MAG: protein kinase [Spirochaetales bacterium]|nr:protein kinase [Spirochaetales bacterium]
MDKRKGVKKIKIFEVLPKDMKKELVGILDLEKYKKSDFIIRQGDPGKSMYFIAEGKVKIRAKDKEDVILDEGDFVGESALISGAPRTADVVAATDVTLLVLTREIFEQKLQSNPLFSGLLTQVFTDRLGAPTDKLADKKLGKYRILYEVGRGGNGIIYFGKHMTLEIPVAIKMLHHRFVMDTENLQRFLREAKIIAALNHQNIRQVVDIEQAYGTYFIIMDYVEGKSLSAFLKNVGRLSMPVCREVLFQIADGLAYAHQQGVVHRDVKPGNILIDKAGNIKISDFGIAQSQNKKNSHEDDNSLAGTPYYMSPEQIERHTVDSRSDIYSFGVLCYWLLTGRVPFDGSDAITIFSKHLNQDYIPPEELNPQIPTDLKILIKRTLEKDRNKRLQSLHNMRELLAIWAFGEELSEPLFKFFSEENELARNFQNPRQTLTALLKDADEMADVIEDPSPVYKAIENAKKLKKLEMEFQPSLHPEPPVMEINYKGPSKEEPKFFIPDTGKMVLLEKERIDVAEVHILTLLMAKANSIVEALKILGNWCVQKKWHAGIWLVGANETQDLLKYDVDVNELLNLADKNTIQFRRQEKGFALPVIIYQNEKLTVLFSLFSTEADTLQKELFFVQLLEKSAKSILPLLNQ